MRSNPSHPIAVGTFAALAIGCADVPPTGSAASGVGLQLNYSNGPDQLANVFRFEGTVGGGFILDPAADLIVFGGLPEDPGEAMVCSGTEDFELGDIQLVGLLREVIQALIQAEVHMHVYRLGTFSDFCTDAPLAQGVGRFTLNDNDIGVSHTRMNSFGVRLNGPVTLAGGGTARLAAHARFLIDRDDGFTVATSDIHLSH